MTTFILAGWLSVIALLERVPVLRVEPQRLLRRHCTTDLLYLVTGVMMLGLAVRGLADALAHWLGVSGRLFPTVAAPLAVVPAIVLYDLAGYLAHLLLHRVEVLWRLHEVHHSSRALDWLAAYRAHVGEHALRHLLSTATLLLIGFSLPVVSASGTIYAAWAALNHSNLGIRLRVLEPLLVTPRLHRLHHVPATSESNLGTIFSVWDRMRGTLVVDPEAPTRPLGVPGRVDTYPQSWLPQLVEPARAWRRGWGAPRRRGGGSRRAA